MITARLLDGATSNFACIAALAFVYARLREDTPRHALRFRVKTVAAFVATNIAVLLATPSIGAGVRPDMRHVLVAAATVWAGPEGGLVVGATAIAARFALGGVETPLLPFVGTATAWLLGVLAHRRSSMHGVSRRMGWATAFGLLPVLLATLVARVAYPSFRPAHNEGALALYGAVAFTLALVLLELLHLADRAEDERANLNASRRREALSLQAASSGFWRWEPATTTLHADPHLARALGVIHPDGLDCEIHPTDLDMLRDAFGADRRLGDTELRLRHARGDWRWLRLSGAPLQDGVIAGIAVDVTDTHTARDRVTDLLRNDVLTGLVNRATLLAELDARTGTTEDQLALYVVDIVHFAAFNATHGMEAGDALLKDVAERLRAAAPEAQVARVGADSFGILEVLPTGASFEDTARGRGEALLAAVHAPGTATSHPFRACIGVSRFAPSAPVSAQDLLIAAENAAAVAREHGHGAVATDGWATRQELRGRLVLEQKVGAALQNGELWLAWQAQFATDGTLLGAEVLMRWSPPEGAVSPAVFIPVAERTGDIVAMGEWALRQACRQLKVWIEAGIVGRLHHVAMNVSMVQLERGHLSERFPAICAEVGVSPNHFELEITESVMMRDPAQVVRELNALRDAGFTLAIDDFGTGYSSLAMLRTLPFTRLKIDRGFTCRITAEDADRAIVATMIDVARTLHMSVVAEGVEQPEELRRLSMLGCNVHQGYLGARPVDARTFEGTLRDGRVSLPVTLEVA